MSALPVQSAHSLLTVPEEGRWLIDGLWAEQAVGIVGGEPKCCKSFLALDMAVSVASGRPCLRHFRVVRPGSVLLYAAEDALHVVRERLEGICRAADVELGALDIQVITVPTLRLDRQEDQKRLDETVAATQPRLLVLDPFVRLHRIDENVSSEVAPLLAHLRELERRHRVAVVLVHHSRKGGGARPGQALRGSSELHAWGDSNLYLQRAREQLTLTIEHRAAASPPSIGIELRGDDGALALRVVGAPEAPATPAAPSQCERVLGALALAVEPVRLRTLRETCGIRTQRLCEILAVLVKDGRVRKLVTGYEIVKR